MHKIDIQLQNNSHSIFIKKNVCNDLERLIDNINHYDKIFLFAPKSILNYYTDHKIFKLGYELVIINENEQVKQMENVKNIIGEILDKKCNKNSLIIGLGGGVVTDFTGFISSIFMRGIDHILIPTTLLGMVDASIGGKTGINFKSKNIIGTFKQPRAICIDTLFLRTLNKKQIINGFAEIIKYGLIFEKTLYDEITANFSSLIKLHNDSLLERIIIRSCNLKKNIIEKDVFDKSERMILNFGHTVGHAIESYYHYEKIQHGEAVYHGMIAASYISFKLNYLSWNDYVQIRDFIQSIPIFKVDNIETKGLLDYIKYDKKHFSNKNHFVLLNKIGSAFIKENIPYEIIEESLEIIKK